MTTTKAYPIKPVPKPRMTIRDRRGDKRPCVARYHAFKDACRLLGVNLPLSGYHVVFVMPMPKSWSKSKREAFYLTPHQQRPDKDNLEKALLDAVYGEDCKVWDGRVSKIWGINGEIIIRSNGDFTNIPEILGKD